MIFEYHILKLVPIFSFSRNIDVFACFDNKYYSSTVRNTVDHRAVRFPV